MNLHYLNEESWGKFEGFIVHRPKPSPGPNVKSGLTANCKPSYHYPYTTLTLIHNKLIDQRTHNTVATFNSIPSQIFDPGQSAIILISSREMFLTGMLNAHA